MRPNLKWLVVPALLTLASCAVEVVHRECGDAVCDAALGETCSSCPSDCGACSYVCGNSTCEAALGETCSNCAADCGACTNACGDNVCDTAGGETCSNCAADCGACTEPQINVYWNINGTVDGTPKGVSWDTCAEVGAAKALVIVDGLETTFDCHAGGQMSGALAVTAGNHTVSVVLQDAGGADITTETPGATISATLATPGELYADFYWDSFLALKNTMTGDYWFETTYEGGKSCTATTPQVSYQVSLVKLNGVPLNPAPQVCDASNVCVDADGAAFADCTGPGETQKIVDMLWGDYKLKIQGTLGQSAGYDICWETLNGAGTSSEVDILVGAGLTNPLDSHDLVRVSTTGSCQ